MASATPTPDYVVPPPVTAEGHERIGDYELLEEIGKGGMGRVFKARQISLGRVIAKMMQKMPNLRYQTPTEVRRALDRAKLGVFTGRRETTRLGAVTGKRATGVRAGKRQATEHVEVFKQPTSRRLAPLPTRPSSKRYLAFGLIAIMVSVAALVGFPVLEANGSSGPVVGAASQPDTPSVTPPLPDDKTQPEVASAQPPALPEPFPKNGADEDEKAPVKKAPAKTTPNTTTSASAPGKPVPGLDGWRSSDIGRVEVAGEVAVAGHTIALKASGADIWNKTDEGLFVYRCLRGDGTLTVRVNGIEAVDPWSKVGVMFRESLAGGARHAFVFAAAENPVVRSCRRGNKKPSYSTHAARGGFPMWVRLTGKGNEFTSCFSKDGKE